MRVNGYGMPCGMLPMLEKEAQYYQVKLAAEEDSVLDSTALQALLGGAGGAGVGAATGGLGAGALMGALVGHEDAGGGLRGILGGAKGVGRGMAEIPAAEFRLLRNKYPNSLMRQGDQFTSNMARWGALPAALGGLAGGAMARGLSSRGDIESRAGSAGVGALTGGGLTGLAMLAAMLGNKSARTEGIRKSLLPALGVSGLAGGMGALGGGVAGAAMHRGRRKETEE